MGCVEIFELLGPVFSIGNSYIWQMHLSEKYGNEIDRVLDKNDDEYIEGHGSMIAI